MVGRIFKLLLCLAVAGLLIYVDLARSKSGDPGSAQPLRTRPPITQTGPNPGVFWATQTWGNPASLPDHFARHGSEFGARSAEDYARLAAQFLQRGKSEGLPAKVDSAGVLRIFDARSDTFGAYNPDGTTKTFFKPGSRGYFQRQPGQAINLRTSR